MSTPGFSCAPLALVAFLATASTALAGNLEVPGDFPTIQLAIDSADDGDIVLVSPGFYPNPVDFLGKAITVTSTDGPAVTFLDPTQGIPTVTFQSGEGPDSVLSDVTLINQMSSAPAGGGVLIDGAAPTLTNVHFSGTSAGNGGGLFVANSPDVLVVSDCTFTSFANLEGGGIYGDEAVVVFENCTIQDCTSSGQGGGAYFQFCFVDFVDCDFLGSSTGESGGGVHVRSTVLTLQGCRFIDNDAGAGGAIGADASEITANLTLFAENEASAGGVVSIDPNDSPMSFDRCTFALNDAADGSVFFFDPATPSVATLSNSILWQNVGDLFSSPATVEITYSDVEGGSPGLGNIDEDPLFAGALLQDFSLLDSSPCIDAGDPASPPDPDGTIADMGAFPTNQGSFFLRGDADASGSFNGLPDGLYVLSFQFVAGSPAPICFDAADADDDGNFNGLLDGLYLLNYQFVLGSPPPPPPGPDQCGVDPTADTLPACGFMGPC